MSASHKHMSDREFINEPVSLNGLTYMREAASNRLGTVRAGTAFGRDDAYSMPSNRKGLQHLCSPFNRDHSLLTKLVCTLVRLLAVHCAIMRSK